MGKDLYSIGRIAKLLDISQTTLRYYDKINLITPAWIDENTGYRYYTFAQFFQIHRIKYLQSIGLSLVEIGETIKGEDGGDRLISLLNRKKNDHVKAIADIKKKIDSINWSIDFYTYMNENLNTTIKLKTFKERYMLAIPWEEDDSIESLEFKMSELRKQPDFQKVKLRRQWGYILDYKSFTEKKFKPTYGTMYIDGKPPINSSHIFKALAGEYLCFNARLMKNDYGNIKYVNEYLNNLGSNTKVIYAWEYDTLEIFSKEYTTAIYELQILINL